MGYSLKNGSLDLSGDTALYTEIMGRSWDSDIRAAGINLSMNQYLWVLSLKLLEQQEAGWRSSFFHKGRADTVRRLFAQGGMSPSIEQLGEALDLVSKTDWTWFKDNAYSMHKKLLPTFQTVR